MKSIEQAAIDYEDKEPFVVSGEYTSMSVISAFEAGAEFAQRWIPVEEEVPPFEEWINVKNEYTEKLNNFTSYGVVRIAGSIDIKFVISNFTHWRPINIK